MVVRVKEGPLAGTVVVVTPALLEALRASAWDEGRASGLVQDSLRRVARAYHSEWGTHHRQESAQWFEAEAKVEAAFLLWDMVALVRALSEYERFALARFEGWRKFAGERTPTISA